MDRWECRMCRTGDQAMYWDATRANALLEHYEALEQAARELCGQFRSNPFGNLGAAMARLDAAKARVDQAKAGMLGEVRHDG